MTQSAGMALLQLERALLLTESFKQTERKVNVLRWATVLKHLAENIPVAILPGELIVGRPPRLSTRLADEVEQIFSTIATNLMGPIRLTGVLVEHLKKQESAAVPIVSPSSASRR